MSTMLRLLMPTPRERADAVPAPTPAPVSDTASGTARVPVPCAARPGTALRHVDGPCQCFFGGPPPEFPPTAGAPA